MILDIADNFARPEPIRTSLLREPLPGKTWILREWEPDDAARCERCHRCHAFKKGDGVIACDHLVPTDEVYDLLFS